LPQQPRSIVHSDSRQSGQVRRFGRGVAKNLPRWIAAVAPQDLHAAQARPPWPDAAACPLVAQPPIGRESAGHQVSASAGRARQCWQRWPGRAEEEGSDAAYGDPGRQTISSSTDNAPPRSHSPAWPGRDRKRRPPDESLAWGSAADPLISRSNTGPCSDPPAYPWCSCTRSHTRPRQRSGWSRCPGRPGPGPPA